MAIRFAELKDVPSVLKIYEQYIDTAITFEYNLPTETEFTERLTSIYTIYPYLVLEEEGRIIGYAYAHRQMERAAYQWNAELSVYIDRSFVSKGYGKRLYAALIELLKLQGVKNVYGGVTVPNEKSEKLHIGLGFKFIGKYHNTGYKCGAWHDVSWYEKEILPCDAEPDSIIPICHIPQEHITAILSKYKAAGM